MTRVQRLEQKTRVKQQAWADAHGLIVVDKPKRGEHPNGACGDCIYAVTAPGRRWHCAVSTDAPECLCNWKLKEGDVDNDNA